mmetsp:Transcript_9709/g.14785  ORF Transcript_9709/g.14785 Transcript_9709/m.14785 type:complete len:94 (+) Transcript_9709:92-373(+)
MLSSYIAALLLALVAPMYVHLENTPTCALWYDGCNTCYRDSEGSPAYCTEMDCSVNMAPYCMEGTDGTEWDNRDEYLTYLGYNVNSKAGVRPS